MDAERPKVVEAHLEQYEVAAAHLGSIAGAAEVEPAEPHRVNVRRSRTPSVRQAAAKPQPEVAETFETDKPDEADVDDAPPDTEDEDDTGRRSRRSSETSVSVDLVRVYLKEIGKVSLLTAVEEVDLAKRIEAGLLAGKLHDKLSGKNPEPLTGEERKFVLKQQRKTAALLKKQGMTDIDPRSQLMRDMKSAVKDGERAKDHLLRANLRLATSLAKRYTGHGLSFLDLIQESNLGLIRAVEKFDYTKGFKFSTYATWWIRQALTRALGDQARTIRLPIHLVEQVNKMGRVRRGLYQDLGREASHAELAYELDITEERLQYLIEVSRDTVSLDQAVGDDDDATLGDFVEDETARSAIDQIVDQINDKLAQQTIYAEIDKLGQIDDRLPGMMLRRFGLGQFANDGPQTLYQIGDDFGLTRERVRQIIDIGQKALRQSDTLWALREPAD